MIIPRIRFYSRRDQTPERFPIPFEWEGKYDGSKVILNYSKQYNEDISTLDSTEKAIVRRFKRDLRNFYWDTNSPGNTLDDTHYLEDFSKPGKYHRFTKSINPCDRMDYLVYPPILDEDNRKIIILIVIQSLKGHVILGQGEYSYVEED